MADACNISVIVVSHNRPDHLAKMLACLLLQDIKDFEVIVVSNTKIDAESSILPGFLTQIEFSEPNIAKARNIGIDAAKGDFIAFCDDDALPDPAWLRLLMGVFDDPDIGAAGGFTRGRNGISPQWGAVLTDNMAQEAKVSLSITTVFDPDSDNPPVMIGTNCAFRRSALASINGFDPAFRYFLDDSDISLRLSNAGWKLAVLPDAQVHHNFAKSSQRNARRVPNSLLDLGRSFTYFCRKNGIESELGKAQARFRKAQFSALNKLFLLSLVNASKLQLLQSSLENGFLEGAAIPVASTTALPFKLDRFVPDIRPHAQLHIVIAGQKQAMQQLEKDAISLVEQGFRVTAIVLERTPKFMQVTFNKKGFWLHHGGQYGKINRSEPLWRKSDFRNKLRRECQRLHQTRSIDIIAIYRPKHADASIPPQKFGMRLPKGYTVIDDSKAADFLRNY